MKVTFLFLCSALSLSRTVKPKEFTPCYILCKYFLEGQAKGKGGQDARWLGELN